MVRKIQKVDSIEKLAQIVAVGFVDIESRFDAIDARFDAVDARLDSVDARFDSLEEEMRTGFAEVKVSLERIDTRLAALEHVVFGASSSTGRVSAHSILGRLTKLERAVFKK